MKLSTSLILSFALISSSASATWLSMPSWCNYNTIGVTILGLGALRLHCKKSLNQDQLDTKRSIMDEKSPLDACVRLVDETVLGQYEDAKNDKPATGLAGLGVKSFKENVLPLTGAVVLTEKGFMKVDSGLRSLGLGWLADLLPVIPTFKSIAKKADVTAVAATVVSATTK